jgi:hypothetical protein
MFKIKSDYEFYCYLKACLPKTYTILSEPQTSYYSEWLFKYKIYYKDKLFYEYSGNFLDIKKGYLVNEAKRLLKNIGHNQC